MRNETDESGSSDGSRNVSHDRVGPLILTSLRPLTRMPDRVRFLPSFDFVFVLTA